MSEYSTVKVAGLCKMTGGDCHLYKVGEMIECVVDGARWASLGHLSRYTQTCPSKSLRRARVQIKQMVREALA